MMRRMQGEKTGYVFFIPGIAESFRSRIAVPQMITVPE